MFNFQVKDIGRNGFTNMLMSSEAAADLLIRQLKVEVDNRRDPNDFLETVDLSSLTDEDAMRVKREIERYISYGY